MSFGDQKAKLGATVIEVAMAASLLAVVALGTGAFVTQNAGQMSVRRSQQVALEVANGRLEQLVSSVYTNVLPSALSYTPYYVEANGSAWTVSRTDPQETVTVDGVGYDITTTVQYLDVDSGTSFDDRMSTFDYVQLKVTVAYDAGADVILETRYAP